MKELSKKIIAIVFIALMVVNNALLTLISVATNEIENALDVAKINLLYEANLEKYVNYQIEENKGTLVQFDLKIGVEYDESQEYKPLETTGTALNLPKIENEFPENVEVIGKSTKATNGSDMARNFAYDYNKETGEVRIIALNKQDGDGNIYSEKVDGARDRYTIICYYSSNCYNSENVERNLEVSGYVQTNIEGIKKKTEVSQNYNVNENISGLVATSVKTSDIYNGYIKANIKNGTEYTTKYTEDVELDVSKKELADEINISLNSNFINKENEVVENGDIVLKSTRVDKNSVINVLGEDGKLQILNKDGNVLNEINKDTETDEDGTVLINFEEELSKLSIKTSKPINIGTINITNEKEVKGTVADLGENKIQIKTNILGIKNTLVTKDTENTESTENADVQEEKEQEEIYSYEENKEVELINSESKAEISVNKNEWTNNVQNNVEFTVKLITNDIKYNLYENPVIEVVLPKEVEKVDLGTVLAVYEKNFSIAKTEVEKRGENTVIRVTLQGTQTNYTTSDIYSGPEILIPATISINKDISSTKSNVVLNYLNQNDDSKEIKSGNIEINIESNYKVVSDSEPISSQEMQVIQQESETVEQEIAENKVQTYQDASNLQTTVKMMVGDKALQAGDSIHENEYVQYIVDLKNNSDSEMKNISLVGKVPDGGTYIEYKIVDKLSDDDIEHALYDRTKMIEHADQKEYTETFNLNANEEKEIIYYVKINDLNNTTEKDFNSEIKVGNYTFNQTNKIKKSEIAVNVFSWETERENNLWRYGITVTNKTEQDIRNLKLDVKFPKEMVYKYTEDDCTVTEESGNVHVEFNSDDILKAKSEKTIYLYSKVAVDEDISEFYATVLAKAYGENTDEYYSNLNIEKVFNVTLEIKQTSEKEGKDLKNGEDVEYIYTIKNTSNKNIIDNVLSFELKEFADENLDLESLEYETFVLNSETNEYQKTTKTEDLSYKIVPDGVENPDEYPDIYIIATVLAGEEINVKVKAKAGLVSVDTEISNSADVTYEYNGIHTKKSNVIKNKILAYKDFDDSGKDDPGKDDPGKDDPGKDDPGKDDPGKDDPGIDDPATDDKKYSISGIVWNDSNKDGERNTEEEVVKDIVVKLIDAKSNEIIQKTTTEESGGYRFTDIGSGEYLVLFEYDSNKYAITTYQKEGVSESKNSDALLKEVRINGDVEYAGVTDLIVLNKDYNCIDMGLTQKDIFDLSINKSITKVTATYGNKTKEYQFNDSKLAKVEIPARNVNGAKVVVEYKIEVTNEGNIAGTADEIVDFIPEGFEFDSTLNQGWYQSGDGTVKNVALQGIKIESGSSKAVYLYLTKTLTSNTIGTSTNNAEIYKSSSVNGDKDIDSTVANNKQDEDDFSKADLIISVKTGALLYTTFVFGMVLVLLGIRLLINKKIITLKKIKIFSTILVFASMIAVTLSSEAFSADFAKNEVKNNVISSINHGTAMCYYYNGTSSKYDFKGVSSGKPYLTWNYIHHGATSSKNGLYKNVGVSGFGNADPTYVAGGLYCTEGGAMAYIDTKEGKNNKSGAWGYNYSSYDSLSISNMDKSTTGSAASIKNKTNDNNIQITESGEYYLAGPYNIQYNGNIESITVYTVSQNKEVTVSPLKYTTTGISSGADFYIKWKKSWGIKNISKVKITVSSSINVTYKYTYSFREKWKTYNHANAQILGKNYNGFGYYGESSTTRASAKLGGASLKSAYLTINKKDVKTGQVINNQTTVKITDSTGEVYGPIAVNGSTRIRVTPGLTYTVEEIAAPYGYNLDIQKRNENEAIWIASVYVPETAATPTIESAVTLTNIKYPTLNITKVDKDTGKALTGAEFTIRNNDTGWYVYKDALGNAAYTTDVNYGKVNMGNSTILAIENITPGNYTITETGAPNGYSLDVQEAADKVKVVSIDYVGTNGVYPNTVSAKFENRRYGVLKIEKVDQETDNMLGGVGFKIISTEYKNEYRPGQYMQVFKGRSFLSEVDGKVSYTRGDAQYNDNNYYEGWTNDPNAATTFYTNQIGEVTIRNVIQAKYKVIETGFKANYGIDLGRYYDIPSKEYEIQVSAYDTDGEELTEHGKIEAAKDATVNMLFHMRNEGILKNDGFDPYDAYYYFFTGNGEKHDNVIGQIFDQYIVNAAREYSGSIENYLSLLLFSDKIKEIVVDEYTEDITKDILNNISYEVSELKKNSQSFDSGLKHVKYGIYELTDEYKVTISPKDAKTPQMNNVEKLQKLWSIGFYMNSDVQQSHNIISWGKKDQEHYEITVMGHGKYDVHLEKTGKKNVAFIGIKFPYTDCIGYKFISNEYYKFEYCRDYEYKSKGLRKNSSIKEYHDGDKLAYTDLEGDVSKWLNSYINQKMGTNLDAFMKDKIQTVGTRRKYIKEVFNRYANRPAKESEIYAYNLWFESGASVLTVLNEQKRVDISGYVWQDNGANKYQVSGDSNGYYKDNEDKKISGIQVELINKYNGAVIGGPTTTDSNGKYIFEKITLERNENGEVTNLQNLAVRFTYDGLRYSTVDVVDLNGTNTSKAQELADSRKNINDKFASVSSGVATSTAGGRIGLNYDISEDGKSAWYRNEVWNYDDSIGSYVQAKKYRWDYDTVATTSETGYTIKRGTSGIDQYVISNVNLGLFNREHVDGMIYCNDVENVKIQINGHKNTYQYGKNQTVDRDRISSGTQAEIKSSYKRVIYPSYIRSIDDLQKENNQLRVFVTYKIILANSSKTLKLRVNELTNYYDAKYDTKSVYVSSDNVNYSEIKGEGMNNNYNKAVVALNNFTLNPQETKTLYMQFEVKTNELKNVLSGEQTFETISEISSFTTFYGDNTKDGSKIYKNNQVYAAIDYNSAPGNVNTSNVNFENDTNVAPILSINTNPNSERTISGNVFEDLAFDKNADDELHSGEKRLGNGKLDDGKESAVKNVKVQLMKKNKNSNKYDEVSNIYPSKDNGNKNKAEMLTNDKGEYAFSGVIPGDYIVKFTYGKSVVYKDSRVNSDIIDGNKDNIVELQDYKSTIRTGNFYDNNSHWYLSKSAENSYSDALDNWTRRKQIDEKYRNIKNDTVEKYSSNTDNIDASTDNMSIEIENTTDTVIDGEKELSGEINHINFGIIKRPKHEVRLTKYIKNFAIVLANGQKLVNGNPGTDHMNYVAYPAEYGPLKVEIDNELIEGATIEITYAIKVENISELDYYNETYYKYGKDESNPTSETITRVIDYLDDKLDYVGTNGWKKQDKNDINNLQKDGWITETVRNECINNNLRNIYMIENPDGLKGIEVGKSKEVELKASKLLTTIIEDCVFDNYTEILGEYNLSGKFMNSTTPGNYVISEKVNDGDGSHIEIDSNQRNTNLARVVIIPPTGQHRIYYVLGFIALGTLATGVILIKKYVL